MQLPATYADAVHEKMVCEVMELIRAFPEDILPTDPEWVIGKLRELLRTGGLAEQQHIITSARAGNVLAHKALIREFHEMLNEDGKPSVALRAYAAECDLHDLHPQRGKGAAWWVNMRRDFWISLWMDWICEAYGIAATRNPASSRKCAADVMAEALNKSGCGPITWKSLAEVYGRCPIWDKLWGKLGLPMREHTKIIVAEFLQRRQNRR